MGTALLTLLATIFIAQPVTLLAADTVPTTTQTPPANVQQEKKILKQPEKANQLPGQNNTGITPQKLPTEKTDLKIKQLNQKTEQVMQRTGTDAAIINKKIDQSTQGTGGATLNKKIEKIAAIQQKHEDTKQLVAQKREEKKVEFQAKKEEFMKKVETIKDEKKKAATERIETKLIDINKNRTDKMAATLEKMNSISTKLTERLATAKSEGKDTTALEAALTTAQNALTSAQTAVTNQAGKQYTPEITTESALKNTVGATTSQLQSDLKTTNQALIDAKAALEKAAQELRKLGISSITPTVSVTP